MTEKDKVLWSHNSDEWATPQDFYDKLDKEFHFNLDPCATDENHKCDDYYTIDNNGLNYDWGGKKEQYFVIHPTAR